MAAARQWNRSLLAATVLRWENAHSLRDLIRVMRVMVDLYCASYPAPPTLDIDDTVDVVHVHQQLSFFNAHYDERELLPPRFGPGSLQA